MLEQKFEIVYTKFKLHFYQEIFERFQNREASLTTVETFAMETIQALGCPTINEFASFMRISPPNAAYKINSLIRKGYVQKIQSAHDKREYHLHRRTIGITSSARRAPIALLTRVQAVAPKALTGMNSRVEVLRIMLEMASGSSPKCSTATKKRNHVPMVRK